MEAQRAGVNERGRQPDDPSVDLLFVMKDLQRRPVADELVTLPRPLYAEAVEMIKRHANAQVQARRAAELHGGDPARIPLTALILHPDPTVEAVMFCRHWITPEAAAA